MADATGSSCVGLRPLGNHRWLMPPDVRVWPYGLCGSKSGSQTAIQAGGRYISAGGVSHRTKLFPNMFWVILYFMSGQHFQKLFLEAALLMVFYLAINVVRHGVCLGATDSESPISILPVKIPQSVL